MSVVRLLIVQIVELTLRAGSLIITNDNVMLQIRKYL